MTHYKAGVGFVKAEWKQIKDLITLFEEFGQHKAGCEYYKPPYRGSNNEPNPDTPTEWQRKCDCGFAEAKDAVENEPR